MGSNPLHRRRMSAGVFLMVIGLVTGLFTVFAGSAFADHAGTGSPPTGSDANHPEEWEAYLATIDHDEATCFKDADGTLDDEEPYTLGEPPAGEHWLLLVLKAGTDNEMIWHPAPGDYLTSSGKGISHVIVCSEPQPEETTTSVEETTTSVEETTTSVEETTSSSAAPTTAEETTTTGGPASTQGTVAPTTAGPTAAPTAAPTTGSLPVTGAGESALLAIGVGLFLAGLGLVALERLRIAKSA